MHYYSLSMNKCLNRVTCQTGFFLQIIDSAIVQIVFHNILHEINCFRYSDISKIFKTMLTFFDNCTDLFLFFYVMDC